MPIVNTEQEQWRFAAEIMEIHGENVGAHIMGHIETFTLAGDDPGVTFWIAIADKVVKLSKPDEGVRTQ